MEHTFIAKRTIDLPIIQIDGKDDIHPTFIEGTDATAEIVRYELNDSWMNINPEFAGEEIFYVVTAEGDGYSEYYIEYAIETWLNEIGYKNYNLKYTRN